MEGPLHEEGWVTRGSDTACTAKIEFTEKEVSNFIQLCTEKNTTLQSHYMQRYSELCNNLKSIRIHYSMFLSVATTLEYMIYERHMESSRESK